jgi:nicotinamide riboside kinase
MDSGTARDFIEDLQREIIVLRKDRDEWAELCNKALDQIEQWKIVCERWEKRYNEMMARNN